MKLATGVTVSIPSLTVIAAASTGHARPPAELPPGQGALKNHCGIMLASLD